MEIKVVLFDLDGVLVNACDWHYEALNRALRDTCGFIIERDEHVATFNGLPTRTKMDMLHQQGRLTPDQFEIIYTVKQKHAIDIIKDETSVDAVKQNLHRRLKERGISIGCVTNSIRETTELMLRNTGQLEFMDLVISNQDVNQPKPHGEGYIRAMITLGEQLERVLLVEDAPRGITAAESTGANVWKVRDADEVTWENIQRWL